MPRSGPVAAVQLVLTVSPPFAPSLGLGLAIPERWASQVPHCAGASTFRACQQAPPPFSSTAAAVYGTVVRTPSMPSSLSGCCFFTALPFLPPSFPLPDGLLYGSTESPTPFLCGITMAAGVSLPALAIQVTLSDAILCPSGTSRGQRSSGAEWGPGSGSKDRPVGKQGFQAPEGN